MTDVIDSYAEANKDNDTEIQGLAGYGMSSAGQSFKLSYGYNYVMTEALFYLQRVGNPGNLIARLYAATGTYGTSNLPTGGVLATSSLVSASSITTTTFSLITFTFSSYTLTPNTQYVIVLSSYDGTWDWTTNYVNVGIDFSSPTHGGNGCEYNVTWLAYSTWDAIFYIRGTKTLNTADIKDNAAIQMYNWIYDNWTETIPAADEIIWSTKAEGFDYNGEYGTHVSLNEVKVKYTHAYYGLYRIRKEVKISIYIRPINYQPDTMTTAETMFRNVMEEIGYILQAVRYSFYNYNILNIQEWNYNITPANEPIILSASMIVELLL